MKIAIILVIVASFSCRSYAQISDTATDAYFYQNLIAEVGGYKDDIPVYYKTTLRPLKRIDFQTIDLNKWAVIRKTNRDFKPFFNQIKINDLEEKELTTPIDSHPFTKRMFERINSRYQHFLALSPIIYSSDKTMAVCAIFDWAEPEAAAETIYLLELKAGKWEIVKFLLVSIS